MWRVCVCVSSGSVVQETREVLTPSMYLSFCPPTQNVDGTSRSKLGFM